MTEILSREVFKEAFGDDPRTLHLEDARAVVATIEALAEVLQIIVEDDGFHLAKTSLEAMKPLRDKGWL